MTNAMNTPANDNDPIEFQVIGTDMENTIRALVAYGDTINVPATSIMYALGLDTLPEDVEMVVRGIIRDNLHMDLSDTLVDEILEAMGDADDDDFNE